MHLWMQAHRALCTRMCMVRAASMALQQMLGKSCVLKQHHLASAAECWVEIASTSSCLEWVIGLIHPPLAPTSTRMDFARLRNP